MTNKQRKKVPVNGKSEESAFNVSEYMLSADAEIKVLTVPETGDTFEVSIKPMPWSKRNKLVSKCLTFDDSGAVGFDGDGYVRGCLKEIIVDAPWGATTEAFLMSIDTRLGTALEVLVPKAFEDGVVQAENIKKVP